MAEPNDPLPRQTRPAREDFHVIRENTDHPSIARHNRVVVWTVSAAQDAPDTCDQVMEAQADLQVALGILRVEIRNPSGRLDYVEDKASAALARLHVLLETLGTTMMMPAQHPDVTGRSTDKDLVA